MTHKETQAERLARLETALAELAQDNERLSDEVEALQTELQTVLELQAALLYALREDEDLQPVLDAVAAELRRRQQAD
ncbi:MAG TPA: hypothetical protein PLY66_05570 [Acidobacteriota bacterium]|nr:hypothetical protein [Acidobacteriota bacterium]HOT00458.1 hypothetical protein [Acidobacteriota bacterium]HQF87012.1 hypothetical protein [Acidobacteriota bacterium]HQG91573.1 hypothetical protein [Acidobacteriota bacterium]HQK88503.1 hypothetical protein [Acidobacteriota bacterium]